MIGLISKTFVHFIFYDFWTFIVCLFACRLNCQCQCQCCQLCEWQLMTGISSILTLVSVLQNAQCMKNWRTKWSKQTELKIRWFLDYYWITFTYMFRFLIFREIFNCLRLNWNWVDLFSRQMLDNKVKLFVWSHKRRKWIDRKRKDAALSAFCIVRKTHFEIAEKTI